MFMYELRPEHLGPKLIAATELWVGLKSTVNDVAECSPLLEHGDDGNDFQGLAYAARHTDTMEHELGPRDSVELSWPTLLAQASMLRQSLAYIDHGKDAQAITYALEAVIEKALKDDFGDRAAEILSAWQHVDSSRFSDGSEFSRVCDEYEDCPADERFEQLVYLGQRRNK